MNTYNVQVLPLTLGQNEYGRDWSIEAESTEAAARIAQDRAEKLGVGVARYSVSETRLSPNLAVYETTGSAGRGYTLAIV